MPDIVNVKTVDIDQTLNLYWGLIETISASINIGVLIYLIYMIVGKNISVGLYILIGSFIFNILTTSLLIVKK